MMRKHLVGIVKPGLPEMKFFSRQGMRRTPEGIKKPPRRRLLNSNLMIADQVAINAGDAAMPSRQTVTSTSC
ncbi:MAG: hypothetical protein ACLQDM_26865 [Bradyrhizobium sp.]